MRVMIVPVVLGVCFLSPSCCLLFAVFVLPLLLLLVLVLLLAFVVIVVAVVVALLFLLLSSLGKRSRGKYHYVGSFFCFNRGDIIQR